MTRHPYVAIEGVIGVGKTTLARMLQPELGGEVVLEVFEENPFLSDFYDDRSRYAFQTQLFFLLNRYRQQTSSILQARRRRPVIADYVMAKDRLFANLNLSGDELAMYERVYAALGEQVQWPDLLVYLRANHDILMARIAARDRPYERNMDPNYIEELRLAYEEFVASYQEGPLLIIDTSDLDFVKNPDDFQEIKQRILSSLEYGTYQASLPGVELIQEKSPEILLKDLENGGKSLHEFQKFHLRLDASKGFDRDPFFNFIALSEEMGELARVLKLLWFRQNELHKQGLSVVDAQGKALSEFQDQIEEELADNLAYLLKLSNYAAIDLEEAYLAKMNVNTQRSWENGQVME